MIRDVSKLFPMMMMLLLPAVTINAQSVKITITGIRNTEGQMAIGVFRDNESFKKELAYLELQFVKKEISDGEMKIGFDLPPGTYGIAMVDDENSDCLMEYNFLGIPLEGFGFSDYYHSGLKLPKFDAFKFLLEKGQKKNISIRVRYIL
jgi:uncharacterized protein (DUF2141 family)